MTYSKFARNIIEDIEPSLESDELEELPEMDEFGWLEEPMTYCGFNICTFCCPDLFPPMNVEVVHKEWHNSFADGELLNSQIELMLIMRPDPCWGLQYCMGDMATKSTDIVNRVKGTADSKEEFYRLMDQRILDFQGYRSRLEARMEEKMGDDNPVPYFIAWHQAGARITRNVDIALNDCYRENCEFCAPKPYNNGVEPVPFEDWDMEITEEMREELVCRLIKATYPADMSNVCLRELVFNAEKMEADLKKSSNSRQEYFELGEQAIQLNMCIQVDDANKSDLVADDYIDNFDAIKTFVRHPRGITRDYFLVRKYSQPFERFSDCFFI